MDSNADSPVTILFDWETKHTRKEGIRGLGEGNNWCDKTATGTGFAERSVAIRNEGTREGLQGDGETVIVTW